MLVFPENYPYRYDSYSNPAHYAVSLGLVCSPLYRYLKVFYPNPISLKIMVSTASPLDYDSWENGTRLADIIYGTSFLPSSTYRVSTCKHSLLIISKRIYGEREGFVSHNGTTPIWGYYHSLPTNSDEIALLSRYKDFNDFELHFNYWGGESPFAHLMLPKLPSPHNKGRAWRQEVKLIYNEDKERDFSGWTVKKYREWRVAWKGLAVYKELLRFGEIERLPRRPPGWQGNN
jgi:hypothetical protein